MMPSFLSNANPFGTVTSVVNKFNPFDLISESDPTQEGAAKTQKTVQKEQERPEQQKGPPKLPTQQSPKLTGLLPGAAPQKMGLSKQQQLPGISKQVQPQDPSKLAGPQAEETKQPQGPSKTQPQQPESAKPGQSPAKPSTQQAGSEKASPQQLVAAQPSSQGPAPTKSVVQQGVLPDKVLFQQPGGPLETAPQAVGASNLSSQHPGDIAKTLPQLTSPMAPLSEQPGRSQPEGSLKPAGLQPGPRKTVQQYPMVPSQQASPPAELLPKKIFCPLCSTTELMLHTPDKTNCNTCTQCRIVVCSLCGFNPNPHIVEVSNLSP